MADKKDQIAESLLARIFHGVISTRQSMVEQNLADELGVSRTMIREALIVLEATGIVKRIRNVGTFVHVPSLREAREFVELRAALEGVAAAWACSQVNPEQLQELEALATQADETVQDRDFNPGIVDTEMAFHGRLVDTARNEHLGKTVRRCIGMLALARFHYDSSSLYAIPLGEEYHEGLAHMDIVRALRDGDRQKAERTTRQHVLCGRERLVSPSAPGESATGESISMLVEAFV